MEFVERPWKGRMFIHYCMASCFMLCRPPLSAAAQKKLTKNLFQDIERMHFAEVLGMQAVKFDKFFE